MLTESDRKLLTAAIGECWHEPEWYCDRCQRVVQPAMVRFNETHDGCGGYCSIKENRTFLTADDWELVLEKVVRPHVKAFNRWLEGPYWDFRIAEISFLYAKLEWFLTLSIEERMELVIAFGRERLGW